MFPNELVRQQKAKLRLAIGFVIAGTVVLALLVIVQTFPTPLWLWALFAAAFVFFEWNTVEVNDKLYASPSAMVLMTAVVAFGYDSAVLGAACMGALALVTPTDIRQRQWFQPAVNFGQIIITVSAGAAVFSVVMDRSPSAPRISGVSRLRRQSQP